MHRCRPYRFMNPLSGIFGAHIVTLCYRAASPHGDGRWFAATKTHSLAHPLTVPCPLTPVRWTFTFSAKERDAETGLTYFGARYYSSDLSIWLSVDPMSDKYPSLSPYVYCANNPVKLVDPNGMEVINPYKKMIETAKKDISNAKIRLSNLQRGTPEYKSEKQQLQAARKDKRTAMSNYMTVLMAIKEVKQYNKELYDRMNNLTDQTGAPVDVFVTVDEKLGAGKASQCTNNWQNGHFSLFDLDNRISSSNGVKVSLNPTASSDMGLTLSHEFGHLDYIVPNIITYNKWLIDNELNRSSYDGHSEKPLDLSGVSARDAEKTHIRNRRGF